MSYDLTGTVKLIQDPQSFASGFTKREMVVTVPDGRYSQDINLEFLQDKVGLLDGLSVGQEIKVFFDIRGREFNGRYFNNLVGWKIESATAAPPAGGAEANGPIDFPEPEFDEENDTDFSTDWDDVDTPF